MIFCLHTLFRILLIKKYKNTDKLLQYFIFCDIIYQEIKKGGEEVE